MQVDLLLTLSVAPVHRRVHRQPHSGSGATRYVRYDGVTILLFAAGLIAIARRASRPSGRWTTGRDVARLGRPVGAAVRGDGRAARRPAGLFVAFEGGEGAGKSTQVRRLAEWLAGLGHEVVVTHEPGGTPVGTRLRALLLDRETAGLSPRAEALLYAADRAHTSTRVVRPALERGAVVVTDRYVDSSIAYQAAGRVLPESEIRELSDWATDGLLPRAHRAARHRPGDRAAPALRAGRPDRVRVPRVPPAGPRRVS